MKLDQADTESRVLHARLKAALSTTQPLRGDELRAIAGWLKERIRHTVRYTATNPARFEKLWR
jgi:hypothetical protein